MLKLPNVTGGAAGPANAGPAVIGDSSVGGGSGLSLMYLSSSMRRNPWSTTLLTIGVVGIIAFVIVALFRRK